MWDLAEFIAQPQALLQDALRQIDADARPVTALPPMRDLSGLPDLLRRLRNSGLRPRLTGDLLVAEPSQPTKRTVTR